MKDSYGTYNGSKPEPPYETREDVQDALNDALEENAVLCRNLNASHKRFNELIFRCADVEGIRAVLQSASNKNYASAAMALSAWLVGKNEHSPIINRATLKSADAPREGVMTCTHDLAERETACADGMCPICLAAGRRPK